MIARSRALLLAVFAFASAIPAQTPLSEGVLLISRVKRVMSAHLRNVPNYTCLQTVERYFQRSGAAKSELADVLRLEVAFVSGNELFAWPGSAKFEEKDFREIVSTGAFGTGNFTLHARAIFLGDGPRFDYLGEEIYAGRPAYRFRFVTPVSRSGMQISNHGRSLSLEVGYHGVFWVEKDTLNLIRLSLKADDIPPVLEVAASASTLDYAMVPMGGGNALLPRQSELSITDASGNRNVNRMRLTRCKLFAGESNVSFEDPADAAPVPGKSKDVIVLPAGLEIELSLEQEITHGQNAVGDMVTARLRKDIVVGKKLIMAKGALASGRIVELARHSDPICYSVALRFQELSSESATSALHLRLHRTEPTSTPATSIRSYPLPMANGFTWFRDSLRLPRGFTTIWETQKVAP